jgi:hypothetical protein
MGIREIDVGRRIAVVGEPVTRKGRVGTRTLFLLSDAHHRIGFMKKGVTCFQIPISHHVLKLGIADNNKSNYCGIVTAMAAPFAACNCMTKHHGPHA